MYWFRKYSTITALEQRQKYKEDFCAEYDEYRALHDRIGAITEMFVQLGSKINTLSPGTQEYKVLMMAKSFSLPSLLLITSHEWHRNLFLLKSFQIMEDQILQKYRKYKKVRMISELFHLTCFGSAVEPTRVFIFGTACVTVFLRINILQISHFNIVQN